MANKSFKLFEDVTEKSVNHRSKESLEEEVLEDSFQQKIDKDLHSIAERTRKFVKDQKDDWQKIPYLALKSDGRTEYSGKKAYMYESGYLPLTTFSKAVNKKGMDLFINLETGVLTEFRLGPQKDLPADDKFCVSLSLYLDKAIARDYIREFEKEINEPISTNIEKYERFQKNTQEKYGIEKIYRRKK